MKKVDIIAIGCTEEVQRKISEHVKKCTEIENQIRSLISADMPIDEKIKQLGGVRIAAGEDDDTSWELCVTELTHEIRKDLDELDGHVSPSIDGN